MSRSDFKRRRARRRRQAFSRHLPVFMVLLVITLAAGGLIYGFSRFVWSRRPSREASASAGEAVSAEDSQTGPEASGQDGGASGSDSGASGQTGGTDGASGQNGGTDGASQTGDSAGQTGDSVDQLIARADRMAMGYDYEGARALLQESGLDTGDSRIQEAFSRYDTAAAALVPANVQETTHVFFHTLIMDTAKAFDGDRDSTGYNSVMTTKDEFLKILDELYKKDYVLVRIHDIAYETTDENGNPSFTWGTVMLPEGKKPLVMSQDDVCYYPYMEDDGFASRIVIGEDGKPTCEMTLEDGTTVTGSYDLVPLLEDFIQEHPDFSYKGARAILAFTGYEGILGYRTAASYSDSPTYEADREQAAKVAQCLKDNGWELASHSWGHLKLGVSDQPEEQFAISEERFRTDTDKWEAEVESLIGPTDIILYPYGNDISGWRAYSQENSRFAYLKEAGFRYFCNVDASKPYWIQMGSDYLRMARRNLDGYRLYEDLIQEDPAKKRLTDLFDAAEIFDASRPLPVTWSY